MRLLALAMAVTLSFSAASALATGASLQSPPATYYGPVLAGPGFTPTAGMAMIARVNGNLCGQSETLEVSGQVVYTIDVLAEGPGGAAGCGALGRIVTFQVGPQVMACTAVWDDSRLWERPLLYCCDFNATGQVDVRDIQAVAAQWGTGNLTYDFNGTGTVDIADLMAVVSRWRQAL